MPDSTSKDTAIARRFTIQGVVQGVGYRPFVFRLAHIHRMKGWVLNRHDGVEIHVEGQASDVDAFQISVGSQAPAASRMIKVVVQEVIPEGFTGFQILDSRCESSPSVRISPDLPTCEACLRELRNPADRRSQYPYINCTNCGPRYSIILRLPYDRPGTTMAKWQMCPYCQHEYDNPLDRRYHGQPTACELCGPGYHLIESHSQTEGSERAIRRAAELLKAGSIVAVKGLGGYHLACDANNPPAIAALRERKFRKERPFALLVRDLEQAKQYVELTRTQEQLLQSIARPIVLASARVELPGVSPDNSTLGVMLPSAPIQHLLFDYGAPSPLVLTSGNRSSEPIAYRDEDAINRLTRIADAILIGDRPIARRVDDSVIAVRNEKPFMIRRARGYSPGAVCELPTLDPILAMGSDLKNAIALVVRGQVFVSQHIGDLEDPDTDESLFNTVHDLLAMYEINSAELTIVHDHHPDFASTRFALRLPARRHIAVQHHHAHVASVLAEQNFLMERVVGVAFDGMGLGTDGTIWGGEFFVGSVRDGFERCHSLRPARIPGGDAAARFPVQAAAGFLAELADLPDLTAAPFHFPPRFTNAVRLVEQNLRCFVSTSMGRLFDTVAALVGFLRESTFEGQAAIWLEHQAEQCPPQAPYPFPELDHRPLLKAIISDRLAGRPTSEIASAFHAAVVTATVQQVRLVCRDTNVNTVVFSGGVFQNRLLLNSLLHRFEQHPEIRILINEQLPANDGGICVGQAALGFLKTAAWQA
jgi:hydrogenase maturation protein HypF